MIKEEKLTEIFNEYNELFKENNLQGKWVMFWSGSDSRDSDGDSDDNGGGRDR